MPMPPRTDWQETIAPDEAARFEEYARLLGELQKEHAAARGGAPDRALHAKAHVGARAELHVLPDLPEPARAGIFASPGLYPAWVRYSNGQSARRRDHAGDVRGMAVKIVGVPGRKLIPGLEDARTHDFLLIQTPTFGFKNADEFIWFVRAARSPATLLPRLFFRFGAGRALKLLKGLKSGIGAPVMSLATTRVWSPVPNRWGAYAVKVSAIPAAPPSAAGPLPPSPDYLAEDLADRLARGPIEYDFAVQFYVAPVKTPIEDPSVEWPEADSPFVRVARLVLPRQDLRSPAGRAQHEFVERLSFDPWHAPEEFRPLGDVMRARSAAYRVSTQARGAAPEPDGTESFPTAIAAD